MTLQIRAEVLLNNSNWEKQLRKTSKQVEGFGKTMKTISNGIKAAWAGAALVGINLVTDAIVDMTKAAAEDNKSTALLNKVLDKNWKATDQQKKSADNYINSLSAMTGIVDDQLKPAYATVARQTKSQEKANKMLALSLDIAADKNISVEKASKLVAKAMAGNQKAFDKLYPSASKSGDALKYVTIQTEGMAKAAGQNSPFERINATLDTFKEKMGTAFLPLINQFADWLASEEATKQLDRLAAAVQDMFAWFGSKEGQQSLKEFGDNILKVVDAMVKLIENWRLVLEYWKMSPLGMVTKFFGGKDTPVTVTVPKSTPVATAGSTANKTTININGVVSGNEVVTALTRYAKTQGVPMSKLLR